MRRSTEAFLTTHAGRLERPDHLTQAMERSPQGRPKDEGFAKELEQAVRGTVARQHELGIDVVGDGEFGKLSWNTYLYTRLAGHELVPKGDGPSRSLRTSGGITPERKAFAAFYDAMESQDHHYAHRSPGKRVPDGMMWACTGPVSYAGQEALHADLKNLRQAVDACGIEEAFIPSTSAINPRTNKFYKSDEDYYVAVGEAMRTEYRAIIDAGFILQIDDPHLAALGALGDDSITTAQVRRRAAAHVAIVNHSLRDLPEDRIRYHVCWGSWHGPHTHDVPLAEIVDIVLGVHVQGYVLEAANARHEHEWMVWKNTKLPEGKILIPGLVSHATNVVEHPDLVAWRLQNFASVVGMENIIAGTDCGLGYRVHPQIADAKLAALAEGAARATKMLKGRPVAQGARVG